MRGWRDFGIRAGSMRRVNTIRRYRHGKPAFISLSERSGAELTSTAL